MKADCGQAPARAGTASTRWVYFCKASTSEDSTAMANALGREGWEMSAAAGLPYQATWCFKRALP